MKKLVTALGAAVLLHAVAALSQQATASAEIPAEEWERFKAEFAAMADRLSALEAENARLRATAASAIPVEDLNAEVALVKEQNRKSSWTETVRWKGDFRYRVEEIERDYEEIYPEDYGSEPPRQAVLVEEARARWRQSRTAYRAGGPYCNPQPHDRGRAGNGQRWR